MCRMITKLKPYPAYKDSDVEWLGQVPEHWGVLRLKRIARLNPSKSEVPLALRDGRAVFLPMERVGSDGRFDVSEVWPISDLWNGFTYFRRGDVIVAKITPCFENGKGACLENLPTALGFGSTEFHVIRPSKAIVSTYLYRVTTLSEFRRLGADEMTGAAGQQRVPVEFIANFLIPLPPLPEQNAIVRFLDYIDRRIRRYIRVKQKLIKLLEEYKQALIHQAVTGSIDVRTGKPYPAYKDSGVEWLGEVPEHWQVRKLKYVVSFTGGGTPSKTVAVYWEGDVPWVSPKDMTCPVLHDTTDHISWDAIEVSATSLVPAGTLLIVVRSGILRRKIPAAINAVPMALNQDMKALRPKERLAETTFLLAFIQGCEVTLLTEWTKHGATVESIEYELLANSRIPLPPLPEQTAIVEYLDTQTTKIDAAIAATRSEIELLREYRTRLIADVVTGKVDVREVAARLPEEPPEEEAESMDADEIAEDETTDEEADTETVEEEEVEP